MIPQFKYIRTITIAVSLLILYSGCKKEESPLECIEESSHSSVLPMTVGSYWIYEWSEDNEGPSIGIYDTIRIVSIDTIDSVPYAVHEGTFLGEEESIYVPSYRMVLTESDSIITSPSGMVLYDLRSESLGNTLISTENFGSFTFETRMTFASTSFFNTNALDGGGYVFYKNTEVTTIPQPYFSNTVAFSPGVGEVSRTYQVLGSEEEHYTRRLIEYHIE